ncbi:MAG: hypothetical protein IPJ03_17230 [Ignavibacteriales bacterium]|nr:hypothetical protein [Ignavibacteriales bacterium]
MTTPTPERSARLAAARDAVVEAAGVWFRAWIMDAEDGGDEEDLANAVNDLLAIEKEVDDAED